MTQQFDSSLIPTDDEHDQHDAGMLARCLHCLCMFAVDEQPHGSRCPDCQEAFDESFPPDAGGMARELAAQDSESITKQNG